VNPRQRNVKVSTVEPAWPLRAREVPDEQPARPELAFVSRDLPLPDLQAMAPGAADEASGTAAARVTPLSLSFLWR